MIAIQVSFDEDLLRRLDATEEAQKQGRSAVLRRATAEYLQRRQGQEIADGYARAYGSGDAANEELKDWAEEAAWPEI